MASIVNIEPNDDLPVLIRKCNENFKNLAKKSNSDNTEIITNADDLSGLRESFAKQLHAINTSLQELTGAVGDLQDGIQNINEKLSKINIGSTTKKLNFSTNMGNSFIIGATDTNDNEYIFTASRTDGVTAKYRKAGDSNWTEWK